MKQPPAINGQGAQTCHHKHSPPGIRCLPPPDISVPGEPGSQKHPGIDRRLKQECLCKMPLQNQNKSPRHPTPRTGKARQNLHGTKRSKDQVHRQRIHAYPQQGKAQIADIPPQTFHRYLTIRKGMETFRFHAFCVRFLKFKLKLCLHCPERPGSCEQQHP